MITIIYICGVYSLALALFHLGFWKIFNWKVALKKLNFANQGIMQILNIQIIFYFFFTAFMCFVFPTELLSTKLGNFLLGATSLFWLIRTFQQFVFFRVNNYKIHILTIVFLLGAIIFAIPILIK
ncbi:hypothetical protein ABIB40_002997 [Pedobacter sp. UYP30]|uniref:hypothetical protein n=1 Tax=Pedobacter sp. UYP30 TaxID=1756400 RepID=UPI003395E2AD